MFTLNGDLRENYTGASRLFDAMNQLRRAWAAFQPPPPLTRSDLAVLGALSEMHKRGEVVTVSRIAKALGQSTPGISQKISTLEEQGFVQRAASKADRRTAHLALTPWGEKTAKESTHELLGQMEKALHVLGEDKTGQLVALVEELSHAIEESKGADSDCLN